VYRIEKRVIEHHQREKVAVRRHSLGLAISTDRKKRK
jgi:hypothetical protein